MPSTTNSAPPIKILRDTEMYYQLGVQTVAQPIVLALHARRTISPLTETML